MTKLIFTVMLCIGITKAFSQSMLTLDEADRPALNYSYHSSSGDAAIDSTVAAELTFFSNLLMMKLSCSYYTPCATDSVSTTNSLSEFVQQNNILLNLNDLLRTKSNGLLDTYVPALVMHKLSALLIAKYGLKFDESQELAFSDYMMGYYLKKREFFINHKMSITSLQEIYEQQQAFSNIGQALSFDVRMAVMKEGMDDCDKALRRRQNIPLRDVMYNGISIAQSVD